MRMMKERELCSAGGCRISFEKSIVQIVVYEAVSTHVHVEVVLLRHGSPSRQSHVSMTAGPQAHDCLAPPLLVLAVHVLQVC